MDHVIEIIVAADISCELVKVKVHSHVLRVSSQFRALSVKYITVPEVIFILEIKLNESGADALDITINMSHGERFVAQDVKDNKSKLKNIPKKIFNLGSSFLKFLIAEKL